MIALYLIWFIFNFGNLLYPCISESADTYDNCQTTTTAADTTSTTASATTTEAIITTPTINDPPFGIDFMR